MALAVVLFLGVPARAQTPARDATTSLSPFGIGADSQTGRDLTRWIPQMADIGIPMVRTCTSEQMDYLKDHHMEFGGLLYGTPPQDKLDLPGTLPVKDLAAWPAYVAHRVKQANGRVKYWEVWNEPPNGIGKGQTAADYARLMTCTYDAVHAADPTSLVGLAAKSVDINWLERTIRAGAKDHFDYIVLHPYETLGIAVDHPGAEPVFMNIVPAVRKMLAAQNPAKVDVPIIFTELGCDTSKGEEHQADALIKAYTMGIAQGVACIQWFEGIDGDSGPMGLLDAHGNPRPAYTAMRQMIRRLGQHPTYLGWVLFNQQDYGFVFQGAETSVLITWASVGNTDDVHLAHAVTILDPLSEKTSTSDTLRLATSPTLVLGVPGELLDLAQANKGKPFPWDGDYTNAKSVSVAFARTNIEKGLHTQSAAVIARDVMAYGGSARSGSVPGGSVFMVDPNFLSYTSTPIEIDITVRRDEANENAGFNVLYESTTGYKKRGWFTVPDNKEWHTIQLKIDDAQFVNMWGFNFSLDSDGNRYNHYDIQSVTVTKLAN